MKDHTRLEAWQEARHVTLQVLKITQKHWRPWAAALTNQLQRSSLSVQLNIAEGSTFGDSPSYTRFLGIAYGSAVETGEILQLLKESGALPEPDCERILEHSSRCQRLLLGLLKKKRPMT